MRESERVRERERVCVYVCSQKDVIVVYSITCHFMNGVVRSIMQCISFIDCRVSDLLADGSDGISARQELVSSAFNTM